MKITGWIILIFGVLAFIGSQLGEHPSAGSLFWVGLGAYLIYRANQKAQEKEDKNKWENGQ